MAERDFFNITQHISYPLIEGTEPTYSLGTLAKDLFCDAGFTLGLNSLFDPEVHRVYLYRFTLDGVYAIFDFRSDATGLVDYRFEFVFPYTAAAGCTSMVEPVDLLDIADPSRGYAFLSIGNLEPLTWVASGTYVLTTPVDVEPGLLQTLVKAYVTSINVANDPRSCPTDCCPSSSSSLSSESSSVSVESVAHPAPSGTGLVGEVLLTPGYNSQVFVNVSDNALELNALKGEGEGETCVDLLVSASELLEDPDEDGNPVCESCDTYIRSINGRPADGGALRLATKAGINVVSEASSNRLRLKFKPVTGSSSSSGMP